MALPGICIECFEARELVRGPVRALARFIAVSRLAAPATNPESRLGKIILLSAAPTDASPEARPVFLVAGPAHYDLIQVFWLGETSMARKIIIKKIDFPNFARCTAFKSYKSAQSTDGLVKSRVFHPI